MKPARGLGCLIAFCLPFIAVGLFSGVKVMQALAAGDLRTAGFMAIFALTFGTAGFGLVAMGVAGQKQAALSAQLQAEHPAEPWFWRPGWGTGWIDDSARVGNRLFLGFAFLWTLIALPTGYVGVKEALRDNRLALIALIFPIVSVGLVANAIRNSIRARKYGTSRLQLATKPGVIGHGLSGTVHVSAVFPPSEGFDVTFSCWRIVRSGTGKSRSTTETILWQEQERVPARRGSGAPGEGIVTLLPVAFRIPADAIDSDERNPDNRVVWRLQVAASVPGVDYGATFEVPVFRTDASALPLAPDEERVLGPEPSTLPYQQPQNSPIRVSTTARGTEIFFSAGRNPGVAGGLTGFAVLWGGVVALLAHLKAPALFLVIFGLAELAFLYGVAWMWLGVVRVTVSARGVSVARGLGSPARSTDVAPSEVASVDVRIGMQSGNLPLYQLSIVRANGRRLSAGGGIRDKREAEWLAGKIKSALGEAQR